MKQLVNEIKNLQKSKIRNKIRKRLNEFKSFKNKNNRAWFSELCFCILTANSKAETAIKIQKEIGNNFHTLNQKEIKECIKKNKHRFYNNKTRYIMEARKYSNIKSIIKKEKNPREWLVQNIKGLGYKEASHFLRNIGYKNLAILDRHILNLMLENKILKEKPKVMNKKNYIKIEEKFRNIANNLNMDQAELDLYMWYIKTNKILK